MTEKELLVQLTTTQLREIVEYPKASYNDLRVLFGGTKLPSGLYDSCNRFESYN